MQRCRGLRWKIAKLGGILGLISLALIRERADMYLLMEKPGC